MTNRKFLRRVYRTPGEFREDFRFIWANRPMIRRAMRELVPPAFRERLMMVVTEVNGCRYCSYFHARNALASGVSPDELRELLDRSIPKDTPPDELSALMYAQHWAESGAHPDPEPVRRLVEIYGPEKAEAIHIVLRMIRVGNLLGNLWDYLLYRLTFGLAGLREDEMRYANS
jgi:AhpD family alkylhydroperoxidase